MLMSGQGTGAPGPTRKYERSPCAMQVRLRRFAQSHWRTGLCTDISEAGMGLNTEEVLVVGEIVDIELVQPAGVASFRGRVIYRQMQHYGVAFLELS